MQKPGYIVLLPVLVLLLFIGCVVEDPGNEDPDPEPGQTIYYVAVDGNDANDGSQSSPWGTIQHALNLLKPGEKLVINSGTYREALYLNRSGNSGNVITIEGVDAASTILDGTQVSRDLMFLENSRYIVIANLTFRKAPRAGLRLSFSHQVEIRNCRFLQNGRWGVFTDFSDDTTISNCEAAGSIEEHGIYISNSSDNATIQGNIVYGNYASGIQINADPSMGDDGISSNCLIENNLVSDNGRAGGAAVNLASVRDSVVQNNMIYKNYAGGIAAWDDGQGHQWGCRDLTVIHNTVFFRAGEGRWAISIKNGSTGARIFNNLLMGGRRGGFECDSSSMNGLQMDRNVYYRHGSIYVVNRDDLREYTLTGWQLLGYDQGSVVAAPLGLFVDTDRDDFHLRSLSVAIDMGTDRGLAYDFEGDNRPKGSAPDVGADEKE